MVLLETAVLCEPAVSNDRDRPAYMLYVYCDLELAETGIERYSEII